MTNSRAQLRVAMRLWPEIDEETRRFLAGLQWRVCQVVILVCGQGLSQAEAARRLGVCERTVRYDLDAACSLIDF